MLRARCQEPDAELGIGKRDMYVWFDAMKHGNECEFVKVFCTGTGDPIKQKNRRTVFICYDFEGVMSRRARQDQSGSIPTTEFMLCMTQDQFSAKEKKRLHYPGSVRGDHVGPVVLPDPDKCWTVTFAEKKEMLGKMWVRVGGRTEGLAAEERQQREHNTVVPVSYHSKPFVFWEDFIHAYSCEGIIDLCCLDETIALACILHDIPYTGLHGRIQF
ncbi:MAG: hypothetical protein GY721_07665 [Deltaproteobacteria bacterium]|nr:hypothetical protein [Deltaproteobacteria bacterium]